MKCRYIHEWDIDYPQCTAGGKTNPKNDIEGDKTVYDKYCSNKYWQCGRYKDQQSIDRSPILSKFIIFLLIIFIWTSIVFILLSVNSPEANDLGNDLRFVMVGSIINVIFGILLAYSKK